MSNLHSVRWVYLACLLALLTLCAHSWGNEQEFPGRALFSTARTISTQALKKFFKQSLVVDVRSAYEYQTLRIKGAIHLSLYDPKFAEKIKALRADNDKIIVFYCNGRSCYKSYKAEAKARAAGIYGPMKVYDAGVFEWATTHSDQSVLLGKSPVAPILLLTKEDFKKHTLSPDDFAAKVNADDAPLLLDIRSFKQRRGNGIYVTKETHIPLENQIELDRFIAQAANTEKPLLVYDMAGKQVRWFQYYLNDRGVQEYYFLQGGYRAFFK